ncbi:aminoglycoside phosphotransferase family protein [Bailinhaonella thermotolerans]|uniref:Aminoglycoside phosphotransferase family protein n=1 Tax=Bailinhaonella thermotolerans TaxID=1070861 RepID=A0A3A4B1U2_9ACTN|nr:aminoglycoside phosphotransferase family protein [Bailinhaonella thermotolerans]RJL35705.1 aminoglycoside phosphotransferase family protein [Bailinhaonella thermotolerans]
MDEPVPADLLEIADALLPGARLDRARYARGGIHDVVLLPDVAAVRVSRRPLAASSMPGHVEALRVIAAAGLPFAVPEPLTPAVRFGERAAVAVSWIGGAELPPGKGDPARIARLLGALRDLPVTPRLRAVLPSPRAHDGHWARVLAEEVLPRLPGEWRPEAERRLAAAAALEEVPDSLVHGDLAGGNVHWDEDGRLIGVIDWDRAHLFDPAIDAAFMAWHGWHNVRQAVDPATCHRARVWDRLFGVNILCAVFLLEGNPLPSADSYADHILAWLEDSGTEEANAPKPTLPPMSRLPSTR